jgi:hypothetical protein
LQPINLLFVPCLGGIYWTVEYAIVAKQSISKASRSSMVIVKNLTPFGQITVLLKVAQWITDIIQQRGKWFWVWSLRLLGHGENNFARASASSGRGLGFQINTELTAWDRRMLPFAKKLTHRLVRLMAVG